MATGVVYVRPEDQDGLLDFGVSGKLWRGALVMYDRRTRSLWSQQASRAIAGPLVGQDLEILESTVTDWKSWRAAYPATTVIVRTPGVSRVDFEASYLVAGLLASMLVVMALRRRRRS